MWWKTIDGEYLNPALHARLRVFESTSPAGWVIQVVSTGSSVETLAGVYASQVAAEEAMRILVQGFDPASLA